MTKDYSFFIISCKKNKQVLELLIDSIRENFTKDIKVYVSLDGKIELAKDENTILLINETEHFGKRMKSGLKNVKEEKIVVFCDDFIIEEKVNEEELDNISKSMSSNKNIASVALSEISGKNKEDYVLLNKYVLREKFSTYKTTLQCAFWRRDVFEYLVEDVNTPWEFELYANFKTYLMAENFYALKKGKKQPIVYNRGKLIIRGKVVNPEKQRLERKLGKKFNLDNFPKTNSYKQENNLTLSFRAKRKLSLWSKDKLYRVKSKIERKKIDGNKKF